ncbi:MAG: Ig-like domain-containing protein [Paludibacteraceae bacterium]|nr:Ig-like domain-containing protein [Paludibacteraceae bacterium]
MNKKRVFGMVMAAALALPTMFVSCKHDDDKNSAAPKPKIPVESVTLDLHDTTIFKGESFTLTATILPANADTLGIVWSSNDDNIATVTSAGIVLGLGKGTTYIYAISMGGSKKDSCKVSVISNIEIADANFLQALVGNPSINKDGDDGISRSEAESVVELDLSGKKIASMAELSYFPNLEVLTVSDNQLTALDVTALAKLRELSCDNNKIAKLDITKNSLLTSIMCYRNNLDTLDIRSNAKLVDIFCGNQNGGDLKLQITTDQFNTIWKENGTDSDNKNVAMVMNFFDGASFASTSFESNLKDGDNFEFNLKKKQFTFRLQDSNGEELSFYDNTVLRQIVWTSSNEAVATISADFEDNGDDNRAQMTVKTATAGSTVITGTVNNEYKISFNLTVK